MEEKYPHRDSVQDCPECYGVGSITVYYTGGIVTVPCEACVRNEAGDRTPTADTAKTKM